MQITIQMNTLHLSNLVKLADNGFLGMDPDTLKALKGFAKPIGIGAGVGALGMGTADLLGNHDNEEEGDRVPNLLKSMALGGVLGAGGGSMYQGIKSFKQPNNPSLEDSIKSNRGKHWYSASPTLMGMTNPFYRHATALGAGGAVVGWGHNRLGYTALKDKKTLDGATFLGHAANDPALPSLMAAEETRLKAVYPHDPKAVTEGMKVFTTNQGPAARQKIQSEIGNLQNNARLNQHTLNTLAGAPGAAIRGKIHSPINPDANRIRNTYEEINTGNLVNHREPHQRIAAGLMNHTYKYSRTLWDYIFGNNAYMDPQGLSKMKVDADKMPWWERGLFEHNGNKVNKYTTRPNSLTMLAHARGAAPRMFQRGHIQKGLGVAAAIEGLGYLANRAGAQSDNLEAMKTPGYTQELLRAQELATPGYTKWLLQSKK